MQILHECKDSQDDHFAKCWVNKKRKVAGPSLELMGDLGVHADDFNMDAIDVDILDHLESIDNYSSMKRSATNDNMLDCLNEIEEVRMYDSASRLQTQGQTSNIDELMLLNANNIEDEWQMTYECQRERAGKDSRVQSHQLACHKQTQAHRYQQCPHPSQASTRQQMIGHTTPQNHKCVAM